MIHNHSILNKQIFFLRLVFSLLFSAEISSQANLIQSIDFDSQNRVVYALTGNYDSSYMIRYDNGNKEIWNLTHLFNQPFYWINNCVDNNDNIWALMQNYLYKFNGSKWSQIPFPDGNVVYLKFTDLAASNEYLFITRMLSSVYGQSALLRFRFSDNSWKVFDHNNSNYPQNVLTGRIFIKGDSIFVGTNKGVSFLSIVIQHKLFLIQQTLIFPHNQFSLFMLILKTESGLVLLTLDWLNGLIILISDISIIVTLHSRIIL
ncbi:MAG: hypothetical protein ACUVRG_09765 [Ignavibacterium sp.]|uniref:hypothetical protein n=1 Tax=Ignavibacterium sp. TaxID=2651167 RepID=UPI00404934E7